MDNSKYANWLPRFAASIIDGLIVSIPNFLISSLVALFFFNSGENFGLNQTVSGLVGLTIYIIYFTILLPKNGETPGYKLLGLKITKEDGSYLSAGEAAVRALIHGIPFMAIIDSIMILATDKRQGAHDMAVGSVCVKEDEKESRARWIVGLYCGCGCLIVILGLIAIISGGYAMSQSINTTPTIDSMELQLPTDLQIEQ